MEERLKKFVQLVDSGTYTAAAKQLHTSQPALTTAVQKLEMELKTPLLVRGGRRLQLTSAGQIAYAHGVQLIISEKNLRTKLRDLARQKQPLNLGSIDSIMAVLVGKGLLAMLELDSELSLNVQDSTSLLQQLKQNKLDMVVVTGQQQWPTGTEQYVLGHEKFALVCQKDLAVSYRVAAKKGTFTDFLAYGPSTTYDLLTGQLQNSGLDVATRLRSTHPSVLLQLALQGKGIAALPMTMVADYIGNELGEIKLKQPLSRPIVAVWQTGHNLPGSTEEFLGALQVQLMAGKG